MITKMIVIIITCDKTKDKYDYTNDNITMKINTNAICIMTKCFNTITATKYREMRE